MIIPDAKEFIGKVAVIKQEGKAVRVLLHEGETLYSARDILSACGVKYPSKWCQRESKVPGRVEIIKLPYPIDSDYWGASRRYCPMYFTDEKGVRTILSTMRCDKDVREWIEKEVLTYKIQQEVEPRKRAAEDPPKPKDELADSVPASIPARADYLDKKIDEMLFTLLDLKKYIAHQQN